MAYLFCSPPESALTHHPARPEEASLSSQSPTLEQRQADGVAMMRRRIQAIKALAVDLDSQQGRLMLRFGPGRLPDENPAIEDFVSPLLPPTQEQTMSLLDKIHLDGDFWSHISNYANPCDAWPLAVPAVVDATGRSEAEVIAFLESQRGYYFANDVAIGLGNDLALDLAIKSTAATLPQQIIDDWGGILVPTDQQEGRQHRRGRKGTAILRYADHPLFGRLYWSYSSTHLSPAGDGGEQREQFALVQSANLATGCSPARSLDGPLYGGGRHMAFLDHLERVGRKALAFGTDAERDSVLAWTRTADWRELPQPSSNAFGSSCWVTVFVTRPPAGGFTVHVPGFPTCTSFGTTEQEALQAAESALTEHLVAIILDGRQMPPLVGHGTPNLPGAHKTHLTLKTPRPRRRLVQIKDRAMIRDIPGIDASLSRLDQRRLDADLILTGTPIAEALHDRGCTAYAGNRTTRPNLVEAARWFSHAAKLGHTQARLILGCLYRDGHGLPKDIAKAISLWEQTDHPLAAYLLGLAYSDGCGVTRDIVVAGQCFTKAASAGHLDAIVRLLALLDSGRLPAIEPVEPLLWRQRAAARGDRAAHDQVFPVTKAIMDTLFTLAMAAPALPSPMREWRIVSLEEARPTAMPATTFAGYLEVLYSTQYLQPDETPGFAQVWIYELLDNPPFTLAEVGMRKPLS